MDQKTLCEWLRNNSSGVYRPSSEAADLIERQRAAMQEAVYTIKELCDHFNVPLPEATLKRLGA